MAREQITIYRDDLTGEPIEEGDVVTLRFTWSGTAYQLDLTSANATKMDAAMQEYVKHATPVHEAVAERYGAPAAPRTRRPRGSVPLDTNKLRTQEMRLWLQENGFKIGQKGRIPAEMVAAYEAAHTDA